jgi:hypothetical protein
MRTRIVGIVMAAALVVVAAAAADGGPGPGVVQAWDGVTKGKVRIVAVPSVGWTSIQIVQRHGGRVVNFMNVKGNWGIPLVAFDGTSDALRPDGRTLVIATPPSRTLSAPTSFAFADIKQMRVTRTISVRGSFSFDALSPDQRYLYLVEYVSNVNINKYRVRAYDLRTNRLLPKIVSDRRSWETTMEGQPLSRVSRDGWAYTLYGGAGRPFIHALDTRHVEAVCVDLPWKSSPKRIYEYRLSWDRAGRLVVRGRNGHILLTVRRDFAT